MSTYPEYLAAARDAADSIGTAFPAVGYLLRQFVEKASGRGWRQHYVDEGFQAMLQLEDLASHAGVCAVIDSLHTRFLMLNMEVN